MIEIDTSPLTILLFIILALAVLWASVYLSALLSQAIFLFGVLAIIGIVYGVSVRLQKRLTGDSRRGDL